MSSNWMSGFDNPRRRRADVNQIWNVDFAPLSLDEIAVHKAKIKSLEHTLEQKLKHFLGPLLVLIGPPGCGKTTALTLVSKKLGIEIHEWINPIQVDLTDFVDEERQRFMKTHDSQATLFSEFLFKSNRYKGLNFSNALDCGRKFFLVKDLPNSFLTEPTRFWDIVEKYCNFPQAAPCVFIISDEGIHLNKTLFPEDLIINAKIDVLKFNSITSTAMLKALHNIVFKASKCILPNFKSPTNEDLENIVKANNGDIRSAVNLLQFFCFKITKKNFNSFAIKPSKINKIDIDVKSYVIRSKDENVSLFRVLGKILHCKRLIQMDSRENKLPDHFCHNKRSILSFNPDEMLEKTCLNSNAYIASLHHNYISFSNNIEQLSQACDYVSEADVITQNWHGRSTLTDCQASLVTRGIVFSLSHSVSIGWKPLYRPTMFDLHSKIMKSKEELLQHFYLTCNDTSVLAMELLPFYANVSYVDLNLEQSNVAFKIGIFEKNVKMQHEKLEDYNIDSEDKNYVEDFHFHTSDEINTLCADGYMVDIRNEEFLIEDTGD